MSSFLRAPRGWPGGLFFTIFLWFFAAQLLIGIALYALAATTERRFDANVYDMTGGYIQARAQAAAVAYETGGENAVQRAWQLSDAPDAGDARGRRRGRDAPNDGPGGGHSDGPEVRASSALFVVPGAGKAPRLLAGPLPALSRAQLALAARAELHTASGTALGDSPTFAGERGTLWLARRVQTARGQYLGVIALRERGGRRGGPNGLQEILLGRGPGGPGGSLAGTLTRWAVIGLLMGALCFGLARYLTSPAIQLSRVARRFAGGDLAARVGPRLGARRDELGELGRDFDFMAERIEAQRAGERRLLGDISHELRSPLARLQVALDLAEQGANAPTRRYLARIEEEVEELGALIGQLLTLTRLENAGDEAPGQEEIDLAALVAAVCADADFEASANASACANANASASGQTVELTQTAAARVRGNGALLKSAVENVVRNALIHAPSSPVRVTLQVTETEAVIRVRDWGEGVPAEALDELFRPFFRVALARDRQSGGTGLGLSITQRALASHGGNVRASNAEGGGLAVEMRVPLSV